MKYAAVVGLGNNHYPQLQRLGIIPIANRFAALLWAGVVGRCVCGLVLWFVCFGGVLCCVGFGW